MSAYTNPLSQVINYTFDDASRQTGIDYPAGTDVTFAYDDANRRTSMVDSTGTTSWTYNNGSEVTQLSQPAGTITYTYQNSGRRATMVETGVGTTTYGYDAAGRITSIQNPFSETTAFTYDGGGRESKRTFHSGQYEDRTYDDRDRVTGVTLKNSSHTTLRTQTYAFDAASNITSHTVDGVTSSFTYDNCDQLLTESRTGYSSSYTYDANGNRASRTVGGVTETYTNDSGDKLTSVTWTGGSKTFGYDAAGRTTSVVTSAGTTTLAYDYENRITQITYPNTSTNTFQYNGLSARSQKVDSAGTRNYKRDGTSVVGSVVNDGVANYTPGLSERRSSTTTYLHAGLKNADAQTGTGQTLSASRTYDAFGNVAASAGTWNGPFGYGTNFGYQSDSDSGLMLLGYRYYDPSTGRFLTRDPIKDGRNWYVYAESNPKRFADPNGLDIAGVALSADFIGPGAATGGQLVIGIDDEGDIGIIGDFGSGHGYGAYLQVGPSIFVSSGDIENESGRGELIIGGVGSIGVGVGVAEVFPILPGNKLGPGETQIQIGRPGAGGGGSAQIHASFKVKLGNVGEMWAAIEDGVDYIIGELEDTPTWPTSDKIRRVYESNGYR